MALATVISRAQIGVESPAVTVEAHLQAGSPGFVLVGLPESALRESRIRVKSAIQNSGYSYPQQRVVVNLAPADLAKEGTRYDLAIAIALLVACGVLHKRDVAAYEFLGELGLFGEVRSARGGLCAALAARATSRRLVLPADDWAECRALTDNTVAVRHLREVVALLRDRQEPSAAIAARPKPTPSEPGAYEQIIGQEAAKRALLIAAAGGHHMLMIGPPGAGKTMLAQGIGDLLPDMSVATTTEVAAIYSAAGQPAPGRRPPQRAPHHSASAVALVGGGPQARPGEITLSHRGVLFLDELPHFKPSVLDHLREPMQSQEILISRARYTVRYPAGFQLIAAMNPCPAGRTCRESQCRCTPNERDRYQSRLSGPLLDRIDLHVHVPEMPADRLTETPPTGQLQQARLRVAQARERQIDRAGVLNAELSGASAVAQCTNDACALVAQAVDKGRLSARSYHKMLRVGRTIADLEGSSGVERSHVAEALSYRSLDWERGVTG